MKETLLEAFRASDAEAIPYQPDQNRLLLSIQQHLTRLLNTRQGSVPHLPDYGLPDIHSLYQMLQNNKQQGELDGVMGVQKAVARLLRSYEPRLNLIRVSVSAHRSLEDVLTLQLLATLDESQEIRCLIHFRTTGKVEIDKI